MSEDNRDPKFTTLGAQLGGVNIIDMIEGHLPELPQDVVNELANDSLEDQLRLHCYVLSDCLRDAISLAQKVQKRCVGCVKSQAMGQPVCPECAEDVETLYIITVKIAALNKFAKHASRPGSRIAAVMERKAEERAKEAKDKGGNGEA